MKKNIVILFTAVALCTAVPIMTYAQDITTQGVRKRDEAKEALKKITDEIKASQNANLQVDFVNQTPSDATLEIEASEVFGENKTKKTGTALAHKSVDIKTGADNMFFGRGGSKYIIKIGAFHSPEQTITWQADKKFKNTFTDSTTTPGTDIKYEVDGAWDEDFINIFLNQVP